MHFAKDLVQAQKHSIPPHPVLSLPPGRGRDKFKEFNAFVLAQKMQVTVEARPFTPLEIPVPHHIVYRAKQRVIISNGKIISSKKFGLSPEPEQEGRSAHGSRKHKDGVLYQKGWRSIENPQVDS